MGDHVMIAVIEIEQELFERSLLADLVEGQWQQRGRYMARVDAARPEMRILRHVVIAEPKHVRAPSKQAAWNIDGTRHDAGTFNVAVGSRKDVQAIARELLALGPDVVLEEIHRTKGRIQTMVEAVTQGVAPSLAADALLDAAFLRAYQGV